MKLSLNSRFQIILPLIMLFVLCPNYSSGQYLSHLNCKNSDAIFTTYAAPVQRSDYRLDQAYRLIWNDRDRNISFASAGGGEMGVAILMDGELRNRLGAFYTEPVITASYPDLVKFHYYPFKNLRLEVIFNVYSSTQCFADFSFTNEGKADVSVEVFPYLDFETALKNVAFASGQFLFEYHKNRDGWMENHDIPYVEDLQSVFKMVDAAENYGVYKDFPDAEFILSAPPDKKIDDGAKVLLLHQTFKLKSGQTRSLRVLKGLNNKDADTQVLIAQTDALKDILPEDLIQANEAIFSKIPVFDFQNNDFDALYWNAFNLMRQCMMPPEGECNFNYYIFSREPKWGWGYGGQVFHESLVMLAYVFMDPESAMNSQRVYMERQMPSGYINYRTGPYLNEQIEHNGELTSSAPWYNWENLEIYKISGDKQFLQDAYQSGKRFYNYYVSTHDKDEDGLCEWGAHAVLECVRDARVAVWDQVGWPANFEGPDINALLVNEAKSLAVMAEELGKTNEAEKWRKDAHRRSQLINEKLWDYTDGFYYNVDKNSGLFSFKSKDDLKIKEIIGFLPFWAGVPDSIQAAKLMQTLLNPDEFWRKYGVPSLSAGEDYYNPIGYWNGPVWVQWDYLVFRALLDHGYTAEAEELAGRVLDNMVYHLKKDHVFWEFYSADDREAGWNQTYIWAGIAARFLIDLHQIKKL